MRFPHFNNPFANEDNYTDLIKLLAESQVIQPASDAYWAATHPLDRLLGHGRAQGGQMEIPFFSKLGIPLKSIPSKEVEGMSWERVPHGGTKKNWQGAETYHVQSRGAGNRHDNNFWGGAERRIPSRNREEREGGALGGHGLGIAYNLIDQLGKIRGTVSTEIGKHETHVPEIYLDPELRKTRLFMELAGLPIQTGKEISATFANKKLARLAELAKKKGRLNISEFSIPAQNLTHPRIRARQRDAMPSQSGTQPLPRWGSSHEARAAQWRSQWDAPVESPPLSLSQRLARDNHERTSPRAPLPKIDSEESMFASMRQRGEGTTLRHPPSRLSRGRRNKPQPRSGR